MEDSPNKQFISCKLHAILSKEMKSFPVPFHPAWDVTLPFVQQIHKLPAHSHFGYQISSGGITMLILLHNGPK
jgi:hypothetical protein